MFGVLSRLLTLGVCAVSLACHVLPEEESKAADGAACEKADDCKSGACTNDKLCAPTACECAGDMCRSGGEHSGDCASAQLCVGSTSIVENVGMFFSGSNDNDGYCQLPCSEGCPAHHVCGGQFCTREPGWADPVPSVTWTGAADGTLSGKGAMMTVPIPRGETVSLQASAESPIDATVTYSWNLVDDTGIGQQSAGQSLDLIIDDPNGTFRRAELSVTDEKLHGSYLHVIFEASSP